MNFLFNKTKTTNKIIGFTLLFAILFSCVFSINTRKANAIFGAADTVVEIGPNFFYNLLNTISTWSATASQLVSEYLQNQIAIDTKALFIKEYVLDPALWVIAKGLIRDYIITTIRWVRTGANSPTQMLGTTDGGPLFITDLKKLLWDGVYQGSGIFINSYWHPDIIVNMPEPWAEPVGLALIRDRIDSVAYDFPESSLHPDIETQAGMSEFMHIFYDPATGFGGWPAWLSLFDKPTNMPMGMYQEVSSEMDSQANAFKEQLNSEALMDSGYIGEKVCKDWIDGPVGEYCTKWVTESPGDWVAGQVIENTTSEMRTFENADEFSELLFSLMQSLASNLITSSESLLGGDYDPWRGGPLHYDPDEYIPPDLECDPNDPIGGCYDKGCNPRDPFSDCYLSPIPMPTAPPVPTPGAPTDPIQTETVIVDRGGEAADVTDGRLNVFPLDTSGFP